MKPAAELQGPAFSQGPWELGLPCMEMAEETKVTGYDDLPLSNCCLLTRDTPRQALQL